MTMAPSKEQRRADRRTVARRRVQQERARYREALDEIRAAHDELRLWAPRQAGYADAVALFVRRVAAVLDREAGR